jgi:enoyl-CoA hydratase/carnithine racemase
VSDDTRFQLTETTYDVPTASFWAHIACATGTAFANDVVLTGRFFTAEEAFRAGLITKVAASGRHLQEATALARQVMAHPQARCAKRSGTGAACWPSGCSMPVSWRGTSSGT